MSNNSWQKIIGFSLINCVRKISKLLQFYLVSYICCDKMQIIECLTSDSTFWMQVFGSLDLKAGQEAMMPWGPRVDHVKSLTGVSAGNSCHHGDITCFLF